MIEIKCAKCGNVTEVPEERAGENVSCPECGNVSVVPAGAGPAREAPPPPAAQMPSPPPSVPPVERQACTWATVCHLAGLAVFLWIPFANIIAPLGVWLFRRDKHPFIDEQGKESLNFQISITIYAFISAVLVAVIVGVFLLIAVAVLDLIFVIRAAISASEGRPYRYPVTIRLIK